LSGRSAAAFSPRVDQGIGGIAPNLVEVRRVERAAQRAVFALYRAFHPDVRLLLALTYSPNVSDCGVENVTTGSSLVLAGWHDARR
jgi:hypothetical protein